MIGLEKCQPAVPDYDGAAVGLSGSHDRSASGMFRQTSFAHSAWKRSLPAWRILWVGAGFLIAAVCLFAHGCHGAADTELLAPFIEESSSATASG